MSLEHRVGTRYTFRVAEGKTNNSFSKPVGQKAEESQLPRVPTSPSHRSADISASSVPVVHYSFPSAARRSKQAIGSAEPSMRRNGEAAIERKDAPISAPAERVNLSENVPAALMQWHSELEYPKAERKDNGIECAARKLLSKMEEISSEGASDERKAIAHVALKYAKSVKTADALVLAGRMAYALHLATELDRLAERYPADATQGLRKRLQEQLLAACSSEKPCDLKAACVEADRGLDDIIARVVQRADPESKRSPALGFVQKGLDRSEPALRGGAKFVPSDPKLLWNSLVGFDSEPNLRDTQGTIDIRRKISLTLEKWDAARHAGDARRVGGYQSRINAMGEALKLSMALDTYADKQPQLQHNCKALATSLAQSCKTDTDEGIRNTVNRCKMQRDELLGLV